MGFLHVLKNRSFALLWSGKAVSNLGDQLRHIALIWLVKDLTGSALAMGTVSACAFVPYLLVGLFAGSAADAFGTVALFAFTALATVAGGLALKWAFVKYAADAPVSIDAEPVPAAGSH